MDGWWTSCATRGDLSSACTVRTPIELPGSGDSSISLLELAVAPTIFGHCASVIAIRHISITDQKIEMHRQYRWDRLCWLEKSGNSHLKARELSYGLSSHKPHRRSRALC